METATSVAGAGAAAASNAAFCPAESPAVATEVIEPFLDKQVSTPDTNHEFSGSPRAYAKLPYASITNGYCILGQQSKSLLAQCLPMTSTHETELTDHTELDLDNYVMVHNYHVSEQPKDQASFQQDVASWHMGDDWHLLALALALGFPLSLRDHAKRQR
jgi:hypothetical protein